MRFLIVVLFIVPFCFSALNGLNVLQLYVSESTSRLVAYFNVLLVIVGAILSLKQQESGKFPKLVQLWLLFFAFYYGIGMIANVMNSYYAPFLKTTVPVVYYIGFSFFLKKETNRILIEKIILICFVLANLLLISFHFTNFSLDHRGIYEYALDRAGGVYGDANNAAVVCLLTIVFLYFKFKPVNLFQNLIKLLCFGTAFFGLYLTFSKTGFLVLFIISFFLLYKYITPLRVIVIVFIAPVVLFLGYQRVMNSTELSPVQKQRIGDVANILTLNTNKVSYSDRDVLFQNMLSYIEENPVLGNGVYFSTKIRGHNTIFGVWADAGIFAFIFFLFLLFMYFKKSIGNKTEDRFFSLAVLTILVTFMLTLQTIINQSYLAVIFIYLAYILEQKSSEKDYLFIQ